MGFFSGLGPLRYLIFLGIAVAYVVMGHTAVRIAGGVAIALLVVPVAVSLGKRFAKRVAKPAGAYAGHGGQLSGQNSRSSAT